MDDKNKTKDQLIRELAELRRCLSGLNSGATNQKAEAPSVAEKRETEQVGLEGALRKGQRQARLLAQFLESCPQALVVVYTDGRILTCNTAVYHLTGYSKEDMYPGRSPNNFAPHALQSIIKEAVREIRQTRRPQRFEGEIVRKDGKRVFVETTAHPLYDSAGKMQHISCFLRDVNDRKHLEKRLVESELRLRAAVESNPIETAIVDHEGKVVFSNLSKIRPGERIQNTGALMFKHPTGEVEVKMHRELMRCIKSGVAKEFPEWKYDNRFLHIRISPFSGGAVITSVDVTKLRSMASALKEKDERFRVVADLANDWEFWIGKNGEHVYVSPSCERITGCRPEEFQRNPNLFKEIIHPDDRKGMGVHLGDDFESPDPKRLDFRILKRGGEERWILHLCRPVYGADGRFLGRRASNRDYTDSKEIENHLQSRTSELKQATNELSEYGNVFSSDLREPLRAIRNYTDFLREELGERVGDAEKSYLDGLAQATIEAGDMLEDLFEFSQIKSRDETPETVQVGAFLHELIATLHVPSEAKLILPDEWPTIEVQPKLLEHIFRNLIDNALKFNNSSRKLVEMGWRKTEDERYEFHVRDNGIGIRPRHADQVFGVFERLHTLKEYEGNGMGLAIVKKATVKLGGSVRFISKPGEGSTFLVTLPRNPKQKFSQK